MLQDWSCRAQLISPRSCTWVIIFGSKAKNFYLCSEQVEVQHFLHHFVLTVDADFDLISFASDIPPHAEQCFLQLRLLSCL